MESFKFSKRERVISLEDTGKKQYMKNLRLQNKRDKVRAEIDKVIKILNEIDWTIIINPQILRYINLIDKYLNRDFEWEDQTESYRNNQELTESVINRLKQLTDLDIQTSHRGLFCVITKLLNININKTV